MTSASFPDFSPDVSGVRLTPRSRVVSGETHCLKDSEFARSCEIALTTGRYGAVNVDGEDRAEVAFYSVRRVEHRVMSSYKLLFTDRDRTRSINSQRCIWEISVVINYLGYAVDENTVSFA